MEKKDYENFLLLKTKGEFKDDENLQLILAHNLKEVAKLNVFKLLDVDKDCLDLILSKIDLNEAFTD